MREELNFDFEPEHDKLIFANAKADELHEQWEVNCKFTKGLAYEDIG